METTQLLLFLEHAPAAVAMFDREMRYIVASRRWLTDYGLDADVIGRSHYEVFPKLPERWKEAHRRCLAGENVVATEDRFIRADGRVRWQQWETRPWRDERGGIGGVIIFTQDITDKKLQEERRRSAETALRESEELQNAIFEDSPDVIEALDLEGRLLKINATGRRLLELDSENDPCGRSWRLLWPEEARKDADDAIVVARTRRPARFLACRPTVRGEAKWWDVIVKPLRDGDGRVARLLAVSRDITQSKLAEEALQENERRLAADLDVMTRLQKIGALAVVDGDFESVLTEIVDAAIAICGADFGNIQMADKLSGNLQIVAQRGFSQSWCDFWNARSQLGACHAAFASSERIIVENVERSEIFLGSPAMQVMREAEVRAVQSTPLVSRFGQLNGVFSTHWKTPQRPSARALQLLDLLARQAADIIDRLNAEQMLRQSQEDFIRAQEVGEIGWWRFDFSASSATCSAEESRIFGQPPSVPITHDTFMELVHPDDHDDVLRRWMAAQKGEPYDFEHRIVVNGGVKWVREKAYLEFDAAGAPIAAFGITQDITGRKAVEEALRASERRERLRAQELETILATAPIGLAIARAADGRHIEGNRANEEIFGVARRGEFSKSACAPAKFRIFRDGQELGVDALPMQRALRGATVGKQLLEVLREDGQRRAVLANAAPLLGDSGGPRGAVGAFLDVTDLTKAQAALRESEERFRVLAEMSPDAILVHAEERIVYANAEAARLLGATDAREMIGRSPFEFAPAQRHDVVGETILFGLQEQRIGTPLDCQWRRVDGSLVDVSVATGPTRWGGAPAIQVAARDVGERKRAEAALREADRRKDEFLAMLAHELRNPLAPIRNALHVVRGARDGDHRELLAMMERQVEHLIRLVDDLLDVARINGGKIELRNQPLDLAATLGHAIELVAPLIDARRHRLSFEPPAEAATIDGDPVRLAQVFANLLNNAAKYTPTGGSIKLDAECSEGEAVVRVRDDGMGISPDQLSSIFDLFTRASNSARADGGGLGVGLALVRSLVELHGGNVQGYSAGSGQGSEFVVRLPLATGGACAAATAQMKTETAPARLRTLVVDDDRDVADSFVMLLSCLGAEARAVYEGSAAIGALQEFAPHLIFLDLGMPGMDGLETARRIRALPQGARLQLVALSGWGRNEDRARTLQAGFDLHFVKPIEIGTLEKLLAETKAPA